MKVLNFGSCNIDYVYSVKSIVNDGETISALNLEIFPGGKGLNQSIALARAGEKVYHAGCVGIDGQFLLEVMKGSGVDISLVSRSENKNGHAIIQLDEHGENAIFVFKGTNGNITKEYVNCVLQKFDKGDILLIQNEISNLEYIIEKGYERGLSIVFNPSPFTDELKKIDLNKISYLVLNKTETLGFFGSAENDIVQEYIKNQHPHLKVVLTKGVNGSLYLDKESVLHCPAYKVKAVDTTAAGDTFTGYFVALIANGLSPEKALDIASLASALSVSKIGAAPSIPLMSQVKNARKTLEKYSQVYYKKDKLKNDINNYIENNIQTANINEFAKKHGYAPNYVYALVKELTGKTFSALLQEKRLKTAERLLKKTDLSISEIIGRVGYENQGFFRKLFYGRYKSSPLKYRKNYKNRENGYDFE